MAEGQYIWLTRWFESKNTWDFNGKVLIIWGWWREHALNWKLSQSERVKKIFVLPGNPWTSEEGAINITEATPNPNKDEILTIIDFIEENDIGFTIVWPEQPLVKGIVDSFYERWLDRKWLRILWPSIAAAQLEWSKDFTKKFCGRHNIPTADYKTFTQAEKAKGYASKKIKKNKLWKIVIKADGLAAGKWVIVAENIKQAHNAIEDMLEGNKFWWAGHKIVIEEFLIGEEISLIFIVDTNGNFIPMASSQDHKPRDNWNKWDNTWGMWAYSPADHILGSDWYQEVVEKIIKPTIVGMEKEEKHFSGFLYAWLIITEDWPKLIEYNVRFGDPETQAIMMRLDSDFLNICLAATNGNLEKIDNIKWKTKACVNVVLAARNYPDKWSKDIPIILPKIDDPEVKIFHAGTKDWADGELLTDWGRILNVSVLADSVTEANKKANDLVAKIIKLNLGLFHARTDIGQSAIEHEKS